MPSLDSVKKKIVAQLLADAMTLKTPAGPFRSVEQKGDLFIMATVFPALHIVIGKDLPPDVEDDTRGYTRGFMVFYKIMTADYRNAPDKVHDLVAAVQTVVEANLQVSGLANWIEYIDDDPFINEVAKPEGGNTPKYLCEYRRERGAPQTSY